MKKTVVNPGLGVGVYRGKFVKVRITHAEHQLLYEVANQSLIALETALRNKDRN